MLLYVLAFAVLIGLFFGALRFFPWFAPACLFIAVSSIGFGVALELLNRATNKEALLNLLPAMVFFSMLVVSVVWIKIVKRGQKFAVAFFLSACSITGLLLLMAKYPS